jgi:hypothetical protein
MTDWSRFEERREGLMMPSVFWTEPKPLTGPVKTAGRHVTEMDGDGMGSIAGSEEDKVRIRPAVNRDTGQTAGAAFGDRSGETCLLLWKSLPPDYRKHAVIYADYW